jgi:hypothetical protein
MCSVGGGRAPKSSVATALEIRMFLFIANEKSSAYRRPNGAPLKAG